MDTWVYVILGVLVIVVGFLVVNDVRKGGEGISGTADTVECTINQGSCYDTCGEGTTALEGVNCGEKKVCCVKDN